MKAIPCTSGDGFFGAAGLVPLTLPKEGSWHP